MNIIDLVGQEPVDAFVSPYLRHRIQRHKVIPSVISDGLFCLGFCQSLLYLEYECFDNDRQ